MGPSRRSSTPGATRQSANTVEVHRCAGRKTPPRVARGTIDIDGFPLTVRGLQAGSQYDGHHGKRVHWPLVAGFAAAGTRKDRGRDCSCSLALWGCERNGEGTPLRPQGAQGGPDAGGARVVKQGRRLLVDIAPAALAIWQALIGRITPRAVPSSWAQARGPSRRAWVPPPPHSHLR